MAIISVLLLILAICYRKNRRANHQARRSELHKILHTLSRAPSQQSRGYPEYPASTANYPPPIPMAPMVHYPRSIQGPTTGLIPNGQIVQYGHTQASAVAPTAELIMPDTATTTSQPQVNMQATEAQGHPRPPQPIIRSSSAPEVAVPTAPVSTSPIILALPQPEKFRAITYKPEINRGFPIFLVTKTLANIFQGTIGVRGSRTRTSIFFEE